jgi:hypothetical protein
MEGKMIFIAIVGVVLPTLFLVAAMFLLST